MGHGRGHEMAQPVIALEVSTCVAIILFEGGMDLTFGEFRRVGYGVGRLTILAAPLNGFRHSSGAPYSRAELITITPWHAGRRVMNSATVAA